jgi:hypothetical protein
MQVKGVSSQLTWKWYIIPSTAEKGRHIASRVANRRYGAPYYFPLWFELLVLRIT